MRIRDDQAIMQIVRRDTGRASRHFVDRPKRSSCNRLSCQCRQDKRDRNRNDEKNQELQHARSEWRKTVAKTDDHHLSVEAVHMADQEDMRAIRKPCNAIIKSTVPLILCKWTAEMHVAQGCAAVQGA